MERARALSLQMEELSNTWLKEIMGATAVERMVRLVWLMMPLRRKVSEEGRPERA